MTEDDLAQLLNQCEPAPPEVDQVAIVERLTRSGNSAKALGFWPAVGTMPSAQVTLLAVGFAASMAALITLTKTSVDTGPDALRDATVNSTAELKGTFKESMRRSKQLEADVKALLASLRREGSAVDHEPRWKSTNDGYEALANLRAELRASEVLWLLASSDGNSDNLVSPGSIIELYPGSPAAARCQRLIAK